MSDTNKSFINKFINDKDRERVARILNHSDSKAGVGQDIHSGNNKKKFIPKLVSSEQPKHQEPLATKRTSRIPDYDEDHYLMANKPYYTTLPSGHGKDKQNPYHNIIHDKKQKIDDPHIYEEIGDDTYKQHTNTPPPLPPKPRELEEKFKNMREELPISTYKKQSFAKKFKERFKKLSNRLKGKHKDDENLYEQIPEVKQHKNRRFFNR